MLNMLPSALRVGARTFSVALRPSDPVLDANPNVRSYIDHVAGSIVIRDEQGASSDALEELLLHEVMHALVKNSGLDQCLREGFTEEFLVSALAPRLHALLRDNAEQLVKCCAPLSMQS